jgi:hypothetical protein
MRATTSHVVSEIRGQDQAWEHTIQYVKSVKREVHRNKKKKFLRKSKIWLSKVGLNQQETGYLV